MTTAPRVRVALGASRILAAVLGAVHVAAMAVITVITFPLWAKLLLGAAVAVSGAWTIWHAALLRTAHASIELEVGERGRASWRDRTGTWHEARILGSSFVAPWLTVLNLRVEDSRFSRHVVVLPDSLDADSFRRLRVLLRWSRRAGGTPPEPSSTRG